MKFLSSLRNKVHFSLPILSACVLLLTLYPFHFSFLIFIAFVPLFHFIHTAGGQRKKLFWGLFLVGFLSVLSISYWNLSGFLWTPEAHLFQTIMRFLPLPIALISGISTGMIGILGATVIRLFKTSHNLTLPYLLFIFPTCLTLIEICLTFFSKGYDFSIFAYTLHDVPFFVSLASIGGVHFVSFVIITINAIIAAAFYIFFQQKSVGVKERFYSLIPLSIWTAGLSVFLCIGALGYTYYLRHGQEMKTLTISVLQNTDTFGGMFGTLDAKNVFRYETVENLVREAQKSNPDIIIYPYALADYVLEVNSTSVPSVDTAPIESIARWTASTTPNATLVTWDNTLRDGKIYDEIHFWRAGVLYGSYAKRIVFPFMDYTPEWVQRYGFYTTSFDLTPRSQIQPPTSLEGIRIGSILCSEINERDLVRENAEGANMLFSIGSNAMFTTHVTDELTLASAQFRASENNRPVVRASRMGPSAFISNRGTILSEMPSDKNGVLSQKITFETHPRTTLYQITDDWLLLSLCIAVLMMILH